MQNMASFRVNEKAGGVTEYFCVIGNVLSRIRFEKYILCVKKQHGDIAELVMNELLLHGNASATQTADSVIEKLGTQGVSQFLSWSLMLSIVFIIVVLLPYLWGSMWTVLGFPLRRSYSGQWSLLCTCHHVLWWKLFIFGFLMHCVVKTFSAVDCWYSQQWIASCILMYFLTL